MLSYSIEVSFERVLHFCLIPLLLVTTVAGASPGKEDQYAETLRKLEVAGAGRTAARVMDRDAIVREARQSLDEAHRGWAVLRASQTEKGRAAAPDSLQAAGLQLARILYLRTLSSAMDLERSLPADRAGSAEMMRVGEPVFAEVWNETVDFDLAILRLWPGLWSDNLSAGNTSAFLPGELVRLCSEELFEVEERVLPPRAFPQRMATLADSLVACCLTEQGCLKAGSKRPCREWIPALLARSPHVDGMASFRHMNQYWAWKPGEGARTKGGDEAVVTATLRIGRELRGACARVPSNPAPANGTGEERPISTTEALALIRQGGGLWTNDLDPFATVPGLRNPRWSVEGHLVCDLALPKVAFDTLPEITQKAFQREMAGHLILLE